ncbi:MAG: Asp-tRNA(Asn)/Glu-tRNA(Gln) amidotransferase subunit GatB [Candidatus Faecisoma sp.]|nr:Asp-tRNA(Asn)/Glu-tRNA(Gln) amidotransferase subunit GatB [Acholeplasma sp.]MDY2893155.1 Asp-tRNA(Asn)/Glu-tRNA(Gln) amidotransferase subunit GatB [Candidatus Faecisoma sp.]
MKPTIGIEVHVELKSLSKVFSNSKNNFNDPVNTNVNVIDLAYPGSLPRLNKEVINMAIKACLALNCDVTRLMHFDRKNYFYADLPKGFQITQQDTPIGTNGYIEIENGKKIRIERLHIEEDTCKSIHSKETLLNFNRAGVPLLEIVSKPDIHSGLEAVQYVEKLRETLLYLGISDVKIEEGSMRCDVNVSVSDNDTLGTKCEIKNIGSISNVKTAIDYEVSRQTELLKNGEIIKEQTRRYDDKTKTTILMRYKETGNDYRYFPEPDIPYFEITDEWIREIEKQMPILTDELKEKYEKLNINPQNIQTLISNRSLCMFLESVIDSVDAVIASNILTSDISGYLNKNIVSIEDTKLTKEKFIELINMLKNEQLSSKQAKQIIPYLLETDKNISSLIEELGLVQITDNTKLQEIINNVLNNNQESVNDYKNGHENALKYLMGQIMKESKGQANPKLVNELLIENLKK